MSTRTTKVLGEGIGLASVIDVPGLYDELTQREDLIIELEARVRELERRLHLGR